ncbi:peptide (allatostatin somatostatin)-like receptor [Schistosoma japonicum]|uniref:Peptide (Allatostatin somatostatin)-like receptor n=1 Tax=Schistosoma japonicum TaxID=6182 RepID=A0A4Z2DSK8_SCHJA|nr:peptide (allatostatin somatostatin)-like receptor [Schistosoma japonicum]
MPCIKNNSKEFLIEEIIMLNFRAYAIPLFIIFGIIGSCFVINSFYAIQKLQPSRFNIYIIWIAIFQIVDLITNSLLDDFLGRGLTWASDCTIFIKLDTISSFSCKIMNYVPYTAVLISNTLLVIFSIDRLITAYKPIRFRGDICLIIPRISIIFVIFTCLILFLPQLIYSDLIINDNTSSFVNDTCQYVNSLYFGVQYSLYLSTIGGHILPTILIAIINIIIVLRLHVLTKTRYILQNKYNSSIHYKHSDNNHYINNRLYHKYSLSSLLLSLHHTKQQSNEYHTIHSEMKRIIGHLIVTSIFLLFSIPLVVVIILRQQSDFQNYAKYYPNYAKRLIHLSRLFSSLSSIICSCYFPIFLIFIPNFRYMVYLSLYSLPLIKTTNYAIKHSEQIEIKLSNRLRTRNEIVT